MPRKKEKLGTMDQAVQRTYRACKSAAGTDKCTEILNQYKYGGDDLPTYFGRMDNALKHGRRKKSTGKKKGKKRPFKKKGGKRKGKVRIND